MQDILDSIEFARGDADSKWGSVRAEMGHPEPFQLTHIAIGNEDCWKKYYRGIYFLLCILFTFLASSFVGSFSVPELKGLSSSRKETANKWVQLDKELIGMDVTYLPKHHHVCS